MKTETKAGENRFAEPDVDVVVVGAGFAGLYLLHRLRGLEFSTKVFESADDVGGTWYWNRYPGARCDILSIDYSYSFDPELDTEWQWSERYATQPEILRYLRHVTDKHDLRRDIEFCTRIETAAWDDETSPKIKRTLPNDTVSNQETSVEEHRHAHTFVHGGRGIDRSCVDVEVRFRRIATIPHQANLLTRTDLVPKADHHRVILDVS